VALASHDQFMGRYHDVLKKEITDLIAKTGQKPLLKTIFFGGGTPSTYPNPLLLDMFGTLEGMFLFDKNIEITIEVNPGTVSLDQLKVWKEVGINRLSIGVQSLKDGVLQKMNRHQTADQVYFLLNNAKDYFDNLSVDLILGLPEVSESEWKDLLEEVVTWPIKHLSMYFLTVHENTQLYFQVKKNAVTLPADDAVVDLYYWSRDFLQQHGFEQYELSNFAKPGYESRHNTMYWERKPYYAFGLGACSFDGMRRFQNEQNLMKYMHGVEQEKSIIAFSEELTPQQVRLERIMLGLRRREGVGSEAIMEGLDSGERVNIARAITQLREQKLLTDANGQLRLTPAGLALENQVIMQLSS
jgi:oxygen-independent coproporphyrinogen-3 oxidase